MPRQGGSSALALILPSKEGKKPEIDIVEFIALHEH
jgi:hypothetical protein